jgi:tetratricopeptide (TPR) repeat protein
MLDVETMGEPVEPAEQLALPPRPAHLVDRAVAIWEEPLTLPTYEPLRPEPYPIYLDRRVYQGSSGRVYPLPFHHQIASEPTSHTWRAVHLENEWIRLVVLPELGGRLHAARDLTSGTDLFYCNPVIKPALVGLAGPWVAGGIELNWPQHHRPATYLPTDHHLETAADGSATVWCSDHDPFARMKGMHGFRLRPDSSAIELAVRLYNRTELTQSFLWWANVAARVDENYQSFFPHDVTHVADHARRAVTAFPRADNPYYGIDYAARADQVRRASDGTEVTGDRLDWYSNIPVPTSYMALHSDEDFFGGYDHATGVGFVHVADHQIAVGKKQWTWGNAAFGHAWDANLADDGSHYIELMAGVFTDNQPDFAYLAPGETKVFTQRWYPIRALGPVDRATEHAAVSLRVADGVAHVGVIGTRTFADARIEVIADGVRIADQVAHLDPASPYRASHPLPEGAGPVTVTVTHTQRVQDRPEGAASHARSVRTRVLVSWTEPGPVETGPQPDPATEPPLPHEIEAVEELAMVATHLELYRHATRSPVPYWREALRRDPEHVDSLVGLARRAYASGDLTAADELLTRASARLTRRHANPRDTRALYLHGLVREAQGDDAGAYDLFGRASWMRLWRAPAGYRMARIDARHGRDRDALHRLEDVLRTEPEHLQARALTAIVHRRLGNDEQAAAALAAARALDPLDAVLAVLDGQPPSGDAQKCLDAAIELAAVGEHGAALHCLGLAEERDRVRPAGQTAAAPLIAYHRAHVLEQTGRGADAAAERARAAALDPGDCYPARLADAAVLSAAVEADPTDHRARALLGHWCYAVGRQEEAARLWEASARIEPGDAVVQRNLGLAAANDAGDPAAAVAHYEAALAVRPDDARLLYERDQLAALLGESPEQRLARLEARPELVAERVDLTVELLHLLISAGRADEALPVLRTRRFQAWEGGEGQVLAAWERACSQLATNALAGGDAEAAVAHLQAALAPTANLGEARHPLASTAALQLQLGDALAAAGRRQDAEAAWADAARQRGDFLGMSTAEHSETTFWSVLALRRVNRSTDAEALTEALRAFRNSCAATEPGVDYFATSLPDLLLFSGDPVAARDRRVMFFDAQLALLAGDAAQAERVLSLPELVAERHATDLRHNLRTLPASLTDRQT